MRWKITKDFRCKDGITKTFENPCVLNIDNIVVRKV